MAHAKKCPFCAKTILVEAIKCKHCGEFLGNAGCRTSANRRLAANERASGEMKGDNTLTIFVVGILAAALLLGAVICHVPQGSSTRCQSPAPAPQLSPQSAAISAAYRDGYEEGKWQGDLDRRYDSYKGYTRDEADKYLTASKRGYMRGTPEYGDFWAGYGVGYLEAR